MVRPSAGGRSRHRPGPGAAVRHHPALTARTFWRQQTRYGAGAYRYFGARGERSRPQPLRFYVGLVRRGFAGGAVVGVLVLVAQVATAVGLAAEALPRPALEEWFSRQSVDRRAGQRRGGGGDVLEARRTGRRVRHGRRRARPTPTHRPRCGCPGVRCPRRVGGRCRTRPTAGPRSASRAGGSTARRGRAGGRTGCRGRIHVGDAGDRLDGGLAVEVRECEQAAGDLFEEGVGVLGCDDAVTLAAPQVEAHVALVLGRVREGPGGAPVDAAQLEVGGEVERRLLGQRTARPWPARRSGAWPAAAR